MDKQYLYVFLHIPKTAGTTFNLHAQKNLSKEQRLEPKFDRLGLYPDIQNRSKLNDSFKKDANKLSKDKREKIVLINGHTVTYGVHEYFDRIPRYFSFFRNPVDRVVSTYNYLCTLYHLEDNEGKEKELYKYLLLVKNNLPEFNEWYEAKFDHLKMTMLTMPAYRYLQTVGILTHGKSVEDIKSMFKRYYFIGTTETYNDDVLYLYSLLGFNKFFTLQNKSIKYFEPSDKKYLAKYISKRCKIDFEIYKYASQDNSRFKLNNADFNNRVSAVKRKKKMLLPFTQVIFDPRGSVGQVSSYMRVNLPYYSFLVDYIKHNIIH